jgi:hypothetical protein
MAECKRRDMADRANARKRERYHDIRTDWDCGAYAQYLEAESLAADLLSREGDALGVIPWPALWTGSAERAAELASEELNNYWLDHPRVTVTQHTNQLAAAKRSERDAYEHDLTGETTMTVTDETTGGEALTVSQLNPPAAALDATEAHIRRFAQCAGEHDYTILTLWAAHCHAIDAFDRTGRLHVTSELPGSGKTFILDLMATMCPSAEEIIDPTAAALFAMTDAGTMLLIDEADTVWNPRGTGAAKRVGSVINAGYKRGASVKRKMGKELVTYSLFCPVAMAGLGQLPSTLASRCFTIHMEPGDGSREAYIPRMHDAAGLACGDQLAAWAAEHADDLGSAWPDLPAGVIGRASEIWSPLLAVADVAGGSWPQRARDAAVAAVQCAAETQSPPQPSPGLALEDVRAVWPGATERVSTRVILDALRAMPGRPWAAFLEGGGGSRRLIGMLGITPERLRIDGAAPVACFLRSSLPTVPVVPDVRDVPDDAE